MVTFIPNNGPNRQPLNAPKADMIPHVTALVLTTLTPQDSAAVGSIAAALIPIPNFVLLRKRWIAIIAINETIIAKILDHKISISADGI